MFDFEAGKVVIKSPYAEALLDGILEFGGMFMENGEYINKRSRGKKFIGPMSLGIVGRQRRYFNEEN